MPAALTDDEAERRRDLVASLVERWKANTGEEPILADRDRLFGLLALVTSDATDAALVVDWWTTAADGKGWDNPEKISAFGLPWLLERHADRALSWARAWAKARRPLRAGAAFTATAVPAGGWTPEAAWSDLMGDSLRLGMLEQAVELDSVGAVMLAADPVEHERRAVAVTAAGGLAVLCDAVSAHRYDPAALDAFRARFCKAYADRKEEAA